MTTTDILHSLLVSKQPLDTKSVEFRNAYRPYQLIYYLSEIPSLTPLVNDLLNSVKMAAADPVVHYWYCMAVLPAVGVIPRFQNRNMATDELTHFISKNLMISHTDASELIGTFTTNEQTAFTQEMEMSK